MGNFKKLAALALCGALMANCSGCSYFYTIEKEGNEPADTFDDFCDNILTDILEDDALNTHYTVTNPWDYGVKFDEDDYTLGSVDLEEAEESYEEMREVLKQLKSYDYDNLSKQQKITYDVLESYINKQLAFEGTDELVSLFSPNSGIISNLSTTFIEYQFYEVDDVEEYLLFLADTDNYMEEVFEFTKYQAEEGYFIPDEVADEVIEQCEKYIESENEPLIITFEDKINQLDISDDEKEDYIERNKKCVQKEYLPIYQDTIDLLEDLKGSCVNDGGLCGYGSVGKKYYEAIVATKTSSDMTPKEMAEYLDDAMDEVMLEMSVIYSLDEQTYMDYFDYKPKFKTPAEVTEFILENMENKFPTPPTKEYRIEYQNPACEIEGTLAYYLMARIDDISVNNIKVNGSAVKDDPMTLYFTMAHEGFPGHLYQYTSMFDNDEICDLRKTLSFIGVTEGWAEYASTECAEYLNVSDNMEKMIYLNDIFGYILCSRVDVGVNYQDWDVDDVYDYLKDYIDVDDEVAESMFYTAVGDPGIYLPYTVGHLLMRDLREETEEELGDKFDELEYHTFIIELGVVPFDVLEREVDEWASAQTK